MHEINMYGHPVAMKRTAVYFFLSENMKKQVWDLVASFRWQLCFGLSVFIWPEPINSNFFRNCLYGLENCYY